MFGIKLTRGQRNIWLAIFLVLALIALAAWFAPARADGLTIQCLCPDIRVKGDNGDLLLTCPIPGRPIARVAARIKTPCGAGGTLRAYYDQAGRLAWLTCNTTADPRVFPPTPPRALYNAQTRRMSSVTGAVPVERCS